MNILISTIILCLFSLTPTFAAEEKNQNLLQNSEKTEVRQGMTGPRSTLQFHTFAKEHAVLVLEIDNEKTDLPISSKVVLFDDRATKEGIELWINNQHSDGIFPEVPMPVATVQLPKDTAVVKHRETKGSHRAQDGNYTDYTLKISVKKHIEEDKFTLAPFETTAKIYIKQAEG